MGAGALRYATATGMRIIGGTHGGRRFNPPPGLPARPTTDLAREALFNVLANSIELQGIAALDLFGGTGSVGYELASRGAASVTVVEQHGASVAFMKKMIGEFRMEDVVKVLKGEVASFLKGAAEQYDFIFADPPYALPQLPALPGIIFEKGLLREEGIFVLEHDDMHSFEGTPHFRKAKKYGDTYFSFFG